MSSKKLAAFGPLESVGAGVTRVLGRFSPQTWASKVNKLRSRAELGDNKASELLSMIGVASIVLGGGLGMAAGSKLGGTGGGMFGSAIGGLLGAAPALANPAQQAKPKQFEMPKVEEPPTFDPKPWQESELL